MRRNGFTLIELLAVIVILAIIALIATPIILGIISDAKKESQERSVELYAGAIRNGIEAYRLRELKDVQAGTYTSETLPFNVEYDGNVECTKIDIYENGSIYVEGCTVNGEETTYTYGQSQEIITPIQTIIYRWGEENISIGGIVDPTDYTTNASTLNKNYYLKHVLDKDNKVEESWACAVFNGKETCLRGGNSDFYGYSENGEHTGNYLVLKGLESEGLSCDFNNSFIGCSDGSIYLGADSEGYVQADIGNLIGASGVGYCIVRVDGSSECSNRL